ncbi:MAG: class I SAM-dependent methyltransferase [Casimicrobiaceae bacterium]
MTTIRDMRSDQGLPRRVWPELLDALGADDPAARRARRDLRRLHHVMGTLSIVMRALDRATGSSPRTLLELGAGDGSLLVRLAERRAGRWPSVAVTLLDRQGVVEEKTLDRIRAVGWLPSVVTADVFDWLQRPHPARWDIIVANLFVHHFPPPDLSRLLSAIALHTQIFFCCEPRRSATALLGSHLIGLLGAGPVTREDAVLSVHAGFRDRELTAAWPPESGWRLHEYPAGLFSHCLLAMRGSV